MKTQLTLRAVLVCIASTCLLSAEAQKKKLDRTQFKPANAAAVGFTPYKSTDFAKSGATGEEMITLPNKKKVKLSDYVNALNKIEGNLSAIGIAKTRSQKSVVASKFIPASITASTAIAPTATANAVTPNAVLKPQNAVIAKRFDVEKISVKKFPNSVIMELNAARKKEIEALPNEKFERNFNLTPPVFTKGDYGAKLVANCYLKGENDPFFITTDQLRMDSITSLMRETSAFYTAGMKLEITATLPEIGSLTAYKLDAEFTARSNKSKKHSSRAKLQVLQTILINENKPEISGDAYTFRETRLYPVSKLIGGADIFTYGLNMLLPVDFYLTSVGVGAGLDVQINRTGIKGSMGPRFAQSVILETSLTEMLGPGGEALATIGDFGVGGELRLVEAGIDYGFTAGININNNRLVFLDDMASTFECDFLRGRIYTFYEYLSFVCDNILTGALNPSCWQTRRVENELFNSGAALEFSKTLVDEDKSVYVKW